MPATVRPPPDNTPPAIAAPASPYGLRLRDDRRQTPTQPRPCETYVPRHEGPITWDICPEPRHPPLRLSPLNDAFEPFFWAFGCFRAGMVGQRGSTRA